jgi:hypothetical protein
MRRAVNADRSGRRTGADEQEAAPEALRACELAFEAGPVARRKSRREAGGRRTVEALHEQTDSRRSGDLLQAEEEQQEAAVLVFPSAWGLGARVRASRLLHAAEIWSMKMQANVR